MNSNFIRNATTLITGNAVAFVIPVAMYPLLSRIYSEQDYALFGLYVGVFSFLEIASSGRYDFAVLIPKENRDAINLIAGGVIISFAYAAVVLLLVALFGDAISHQLKNEGLTSYLFLLPPALVLISFSKLCNAWLVRTKNFRAASINKASHKIGEVAGQLSFGFVSTNGLVLGDLLGRTLNAVFSVYQSIRSGLDKEMIKKSLIIENLKRYSSLPKYNVLPSMLNALAGMMPMFLISSLYSTEASGSFNFSRILLAVPFALISTAVSQVVMQQVSERKHNSENIAGELYSLALKLFLLSLVCIIPIALAGPDLFSFVFGEKWRVAGSYTSILIFSYSVTFIVSPFSILLVVLEKVKWISVWQIFYFLIISGLWLFRSIDIEVFLRVLVFVDIGAYFLYGLLIFKAIHDYQTKIGRP